MANHIEEGLNEIKADVLISTGEQFDEFAREVNNGNDFQGKIIMLAGDIDLSPQSGADG